MKTILPSVTKALHSKLAWRVLFLNLYLNPMKWTLWEFYFKHRRLNIYRKEKTSFIQEKKFLILHDCQSKRYYLMAKGSEFTLGSRINFIKCILSNADHLGSHSVLGSIIANPHFSYWGCLSGVLHSLTPWCPYLGSTSST